MTLYEINQQITELIDEETGEILDFEAFERLQLERDAKIEGMAMWYKELDADVKAIREEEKRLAERRAAVERKRDRLKEYIAEYTAGRKFSTPRVEISWRKSTKVIVDSEFIEWAIKENPDLLRRKPPEADKIAIERAIKSGEDIKFARLESGETMSIK
jgi:hypothetical protein